MSPEMSFEEAFQSLENVIRKLEEENLPLEESLRLYREGIQLYQFCQAKLSQVEGTLKELTLEGSSFVEKDISSDFLQQKTDAPEKENTHT